MTPFRLIPAIMLAALPAVAQADPLVLTPTYTDVFGEPMLYEPVTVGGAPDIAGNLWAGTIHATATDYGEIEAYCIEIPQELALPAFYERTENPFSGVQSDRLSRLFTGFYDGLETSVERAAFQVAVWELTVDANPDLAAGDFQLLDNPSVTRMAGMYLANLDKFEPEYEMIYLRSDLSQDVVAGLPRSDTFQGF